MPPIPCAHCGNNFMRRDLSPEAPKLCNNCLVAEKRRYPKKGIIMSEVGILIKCPRAVQVEIEEICINQGIDFSKYFLDMHYAIKEVCEDPELLSQYNESNEESKEKRKYNKKKV